MNILITGGSGYLGARLGYFLGTNGFNITILCKTTPKNISSWRNQIKDIIIGDITHRNTLEKIFEKRPDIIIHLISLNKAISMKSDEIIDVNVRSTWELLQKATLFNLKKFIYFSTIHVHGKDLVNSDQTILDNKYPEPENNYGLTHLLSEEIVNYFHRKSNVECLNIRICNSYGEPIIKNPDCWNLIVNNLVKSAYLKNKIVINSDGEDKRNFIHFSDICNFTLGLVSSDKKRHKNLILLNSPDYKSLKDLAKSVKLVFYNRYKKKIPIFINKNQLLIENKNNSKKSILYIESSSIEDRINDLFQYLESSS